MPMAEVISDRVVQSSNMSSNDVNVMKSGEKLNFPQTEMYARNVRMSGINGKNAVLITLQNNMLCCVEVHPRV